MWRPVGGWGFWTLFETLKSVYRLLLCSILFEVSNIKYSENLFCLDIGSQSWFSNHGITHRGVYYGLWFLIYTHLFKYALWLSNIFYKNFMHNVKCFCITYRKKMTQNDRNYIYQSLSKNIFNINTYLFNFNTRLLTDIYNDKNRIKNAIFTIIPLTM